MTDMPSDRPAAPPQPTLAGPSEYDPGRGRWVPYAFVGFFGVVLVANSIMLYIAFSTWTGLAADQAYDRGIRYNEELAAASAQDALGWTADYAFTDMGDRHVRVALALATETGVPVEGGVVSAKFVRPTHYGHDFTIRLESDREGGFVGEAELPLSGQWEVRLTAETAQGSWRLNDRVAVQ
jgi:nitrogen fixation protein FixH